MRPCGLLVSACAALVAGCGGGTRQDANERIATYTVAVVHASFPAVQSVARPAVMALGGAQHEHRPRSRTSRSQMDSFNYVSNYPDLAANKRPIWVVEQGPGAIPKRPRAEPGHQPPGRRSDRLRQHLGAGPLPPGHTRIFAWRVTPVKPGVYTVHYTIAAGLAGNSKARTATGAIPHGHFTVAIAPRPPSKHIDPDTGQLAPGTYPQEPYLPSSP